MTYSVVTTFLLWLSSFQRVGPDFSYYYIQGYYKVNIQNIIPSFVVSLGKDGVHSSKRSGGYDDLPLLELLL